LCGSFTEYASDITVDAHGNIYITGTSQSRDFPLVRPLQFEPSLEEEMISPANAFITKISATGEALLSSTLLGTLGQDDGSGIAVDASGDIYVIGTAGYGGGRRYPEYPFPTVQAIQPNRGNRTFQTFVCRFRP
jgi:hypothetical protein